MKSIISSLLCLLLTAASAQEKISDTETNARLLAMQGQRNEANDRVVLLSGQIAELKSQLEKATKEVQTCKSDKHPPK